eukprot:2165418-Rhodomonas_salina.1
MFVQVQADTVIISSHTDPSEPIAASTNVLKQVLSSVAVANAKAHQYPLLASSVSPSTSFFSSPTPSSSSSWFAGTGASSSLDLARILRLSTVRFQPGAADQNDLQADQVLFFLCFFVVVFFLGGGRTTGTQTAPSREVKIGPHPRFRDPPPKRRVSSPIFLAAVLSQVLLNGAPSSLARGLAETRAYDVGEQDSATGWVEEGLRHVPSKPDDRPMLFVG